MLNVQRVFSVLTLSSSCTIAAGISLLRILVKIVGPVFAPPAASWALLTSSDAIFLLWDTLETKPAREGLQATLLARILVRSRCELEIRNLVDIILIFTCKFNDHCQPVL